MRRQRKYSLFEKRGKRWELISDTALPLDRARLHFQNALLARVITGVGGERQLRPVETVADLARRVK
jgi:hypothetical protein